jgi:hypothetical protein
MSSEALADLRLAIRAARHADEVDERAFHSGQIEQRVAEEGFQALSAGGAFVTVVDEARDRLAEANGALPGLVQAAADSANALSAARVAYDTAATAEPVLWPDSPDAPLLLLPIRLETIYVDVDDPRLVASARPGTRELWIRVYPDDVHVDSHEPELTPTEQAARARYRAARDAAGDDAARLATAWQDLVSSAGPSRAAWIADTLLEDVGTRASSWTRSARSRLLPDHFVFTAYANGELAWRHAGEPLSETPAVGLAPADAEAREDGPWDRHSRWLVDFDEAVRVGMGLKVPIEDSPAFDLLTVVGVAGADAEIAGERWQDALRAHLYTDGLSILPAGTPTNNTPATRSGWRSRPTPRSPSETQNLRDAYRQDGNQAAARAARAFGVDGNPILAMAAVADALDGDDDLLSELHNAVGLFTSLSEGWLAPGKRPEESTWPDLAFLVDHFTTHVRSRGLLPTLRIGRQPYGVLPASSLDLWRGVDVDVRIVEHAASFATALEQAMVPTDAVDVEPPDPNAAILDLLSRRAVSRRVRAMEQAQLDQPQFRHGSVPVGSVAPGSTFAELKATLPGPRDLELSVTSIVTDELQRLLAMTPLQQYCKLADDLTAALEAADPQHPDQGRVDALGAQKEQLDAAFEPIVKATHAGVFLPFAAPPTIWRWWWSFCVAAATKPDADPPELAELILEFAARTKAIGDRMLTFEARAIEDLPHVDAVLVEVLDCLSHRVDAWVTSVAHARLERLRAKRPNGLVLGAYGWLTDVHPRADRFEPDGYVVAPSLHHATTAAVLRSGFRAHLDPSALAVDLQSWRVRAALAVIDGVRTGQPLAAVLGYQFERGLHDAELDVHVDAFRRAFPLPQAVEPDQAGATEAREAIGARNVVDGQALRRAVTSADHPLLVATGDDAPAILRLIAELDEAVDAVGDLLLTESVHHLVGGNPLRAGLSADALGRGDGLPQDFDAIRTPRSAVALTHGVGVLFPAAGGPVEGWNDNRSLAELEPGLEGWCRARLGAATEWRFEREGAAAPVTLADLGLCALDVVGSALPTGDDSPLLHALAPLTEAGAQAAGELVLLCEQLRAALASATPLLATHLDPRRDDAWQGADLAELADRVNPWRAAVVEAREQLRTADGDAALERLVELGVARAPRVAVLARLDAVGLDPLPAAPDGGGADVLEWMAAATAPVAALVGAHLKLAPRFALELPPAATDADADAVDDWLRSVRPLRPGVAALDDALVGGQVLAGGARVPLLVVQPGENGAPWIARSIPAHGPPARSSLVLQLDGPPPADRLSGLLMDSWTEALPRGPEEVAGVAFHHDRPGARAPQSLLLAVPPDPTRGWCLEDVHGVVEDTLTLARIRSLDIDDLPELWSLLPVSLPQVAQLAFD